MLSGILFLVGAQAFTLPSHPVARNAVVASSAAPVMFFGKKPAAQEPTVQNARDAREADFQRRQDRLAQRGAAAASQPKGQVEVTFPQKGNKVVKAMQGDPIGKVCQKAGVRVKFDCKNGRCGTCEVSINGRSKAKVCQGAKVPGGGDGRHFEPQIRGLRVLTPRLLCTPSHQKDLGQADQRVSSCSRRVRPGPRGNELQGSFEPALSTTGGPHTLHIHRDEHGGRLSMSTPSTRVRRRSGREATYSAHSVECSWFKFHAITTFGETYFKLARVFTPAKDICLHAARAHARQNTNYGARNWQQRQAPSG